MIAVFLMLTRYRPHLQSSKEYAEWLRDQQRYAGRKKEARARQVTTEKETQAITCKSNIETSDILDNIGLSLFKQIVSTPVKVINIEGSDGVVGSLRSLGFQTELYHGTRSTKYSDDALENHESIWIGNRVSARVAVMVIKNVLKCWSHLKYIDFSSEGAPDYVHNEIFIGGATSTAKSDGLQEWSPEEINRINDNITTLDFNKLIKSKYPKEMKEN